MDVHFGGFEIVKLFSYQCLNFALCLIGQLNGLVPTSTDLVNRSESEPGLVRPSIVRLSVLHFHVLVEFYDLLFLQLMDSRTEA